MMIHHFFLNKEQTLIKKEEKKEILIDILHNLLTKKKKNITNNIDKSIYNNLCYYINNQKVDKKIKIKLMKYLKLMKENYLII